LADGQMHTMFQLQLFPWLLRTEDEIKFDYAN
jgi:hypothetical protein